MLVREIMQTKLITVEANDTLSHAASLLRQHQFHHLPVVKIIRPSPPAQTSYQYQRPILFFKGLLTTQDINVAVAIAQQEVSGNPSAHAWQERSISEMMHAPSVSLAPETSVAAAAQLLLERGLNCLPVIESDQEGPVTGAILVGLVTRSDMLVTLARSLGAFEPGTQVTLQLPDGHMAPLAKALLLADQLHIGIGSILTEPKAQRASLRLHTINPAPFFIHLEREGVVYALGDVLIKDKDHV